MIISVYLHDEIAKTLQCFGNLSDVINDILTAGENGEFEITDKPACPSKDGAKRYRINVTNNYYLQLYHLHGSTSYVVSLRRLLYWFVETMVYDQLNWKPINQYDEKRLTQLNKIKNNIFNDLNKLKKYITSNHNLSVIDTILDTLKEMQ